MHATPFGRKYRRLGVAALEPHRDAIRIDDGLAGFERQRWHHYLARRNYQFLAFEIINFDHAIIESLEVENLTHLGAEGAGRKLQEDNRRHRNAVMNYIAGGCIRVPRSHLQSL